MTTTTQDQLEGWARTSSAGPTRTWRAPPRAEACPKRSSGTFPRSERAGVGPRHTAQGPEVLRRKPMPNWGADLSGIDFDNIKYFVRSPRSSGELGRAARRHQEHLRQARHTEAEKQRLVAGWPRSTSPRSSTQDQGRSRGEGVIFLDTDTALKEHPTCSGVFRHVIPPRQQVRRAQHRGVSGGSFIYVPKNVKVDIRCRPISASTPRTWPVRATLIIVDEAPTSTT